MTSSHPALRILVLLNAGAGTAERRGKQDLEDTLAAAFRQHGAAAEFRSVSGEQLQDAAEAALARAKTKEIDAIAVGGGDGTISTVAGVLADSGVPLGVLPLGTLNHFAKDLHIPLDLEGAVQTIAAGHVRTVDAAELNGKVFINNSSVGIYPAMVSDRDDQRSAAGRAKWTAMLLASFRVLRRFPLRRLSISAQGWNEAVRSPFVFVGNNPYKLKAAGFGTRERLDRGELCIFVAKPQSRASLLWLAARAASGRLSDAPDFEEFTAASVRIDARTRDVLVSRDGEVGRTALPLQYRIRPGALRVFSPA